MSMFFNHWDERIQFKKRVEKELQPLLKPYIGKEFTVAAMNDIKKTVIGWLEGIAELIFSCEIKVDCDEGGPIDLIKKINIYPVD